MSYRIEAIELYVRETPPGRMAFSLGKKGDKKAERLTEKVVVKLTRTRLYAPRAGLVVYARTTGGADKVQLGMIPFEGQPLLYLPDLSQMVVDIEINELDIGKIHEGGLAEVTLEAYPGSQFKARVMRIGSLAKLKETGSGSSSGIKVPNLAAFKGELQRLAEKNTFIAARPLGGSTEASTRRDKLASCALGDFQIADPDGNWLDITED